MTKKLLALLLACLLLVSLFAGCGKTEEPAPAKEETPASPQKRLLPRAARNATTSISTAKASGPTWIPMAPAAPPTPICIS